MSTNSNFLSAMSSLQDSVKDRQAKRLAEQRAARERIGAILEEAGVPRLVNRANDNWDYEKCGSYTNAELNE